MLVESIQLGVHVPSEGFVHNMYFDQETGRPIGFGESWGFILDESSHDRIEGTLLVFESGPPPADTPAIVTIAGRGPDMWSLKEWLMLSRKIENKEPYVDVWNRWKNSFDELVTKNSYVKKEKTLELLIEASNLLVFQDEISRNVVFNSLRISAAFQTSISQPGIPPAKSEALFMNLLKEEAAIRKVLTAGEYPKYQYEG